MNADDANIIDDKNIPYSVRVHVAFIIILSTGGQEELNEVLFILIIKENNFFLLNIDVSRRRT